VDHTTATEEMQSFLSDESCGHCEDFVLQLLYTSDDDTSYVDEDDDCLLLEVVDILRSLRDGHVVSFLALHEDPVKGVLELPDGVAVRGEPPRVVSTVAL